MNQLLRPPSNQLRPPLRHLLRPLLNPPPKPSKSPLLNQPSRPSLLKPPHTNQLSSTLPYHSKRKSDQTLKSSTHTKNSSLPTESSLTSQLKNSSLPEPISLATQPKSSTQEKRSSSPQERSPVKPSLSTQENSSLLK